LPRPLFTARLLRKICISERVECFHLEFEVDGMQRFDFAPGQFISTVKEDANGKQQTRAYSIASAASGNRFDLCLNRVEGGFFSNVLCDLEPGQTVPFHGPHGLFLLRQPLTDTIMVATGTGVAPMRAFVQHLFQHRDGDQTNGRDIWLVYGTRWETEIYYRDFFEEIAAAHPKFHYIATLSRAGDDWTGRRGYVQEHVATIAAGLAERPEVQNGGAADPLVITAGEPGGFRIHAYVCGLNEMVSATRERLTGLGWQRKQIIFERYD